MSPLISDLPKPRKTAIFSDPILFESIFDYHTSSGKLRTDSFIGEHGILTRSGITLKVNVHRNVSILTCFIDEVWSI